MRTYSLLRTEQAHSPFILLIKLPAATRFSRVQQQLQTTISFLRDSRKMTSRHRSHALLRRNITLENHITQHPETASSIFIFLNKVWCCPDNLFRERIRT